MKLLTFLFFLFVVCSKPVVSFSQDLLSVSLSTLDRSQGVLSKYELSGMESFYQLILYKDSTFRYSALINIIGERFSEGRWKRKDTLLILNSTLREETLPIKIDFVKDSIKIPRTKLQWVYNSKGELIEDALFFINNDSCCCSPLIDTCTAMINEINRLKLVIGDISSTWVKVTDKEYKQLKITVLSPVNLKQYIGFTNRRFRIGKNGLYQLTAK